MDTTLEGQGKRAMVMPGWYVIHRDARRDVQTERLVAREGIETFNPRIPKTRRRNGEKPLASCRPAQPECSQTMTGEQSYKHGTG